MGLLLFAGCAPVFNAQNLFSGEVEEFEVNGLRVLLNSDSAASSISACLYLSGGVPEIPSAISVAAEEAMFDVMVQDGPEQVNKNYFKKIMQRHDNPIIAKTTDNYSYIGFRTFQQSFDTLWKYFTASVVHPRFSGSTLEIVKKRISQRLEIIPEDPAPYSRYLSKVVLQAETPQGRFPTKEGIRQLTVRDLNEYFEYSIIKPRLLLVVSGNITRARLQEYIRTSDLNELMTIDGYIPKAFNGKTPEPVIVFGQLQRSLPTMYVLGILRGPSSFSQEYYAFRRMVSILQGGMYIYLRLKTGLSYSPVIDFIDGSPSYCMMSFQATSVREAMLAMHIALSKVKNGIFWSHRVEKYSQSRVYALMEQQNTWQRACELGKAQLMTGSWKNAFAHYGNIKAGMLHKTAVRYIDNISWVVIGDTTRLDRSWFSSH